MGTVDPVALLEAYARGLNGPSANGHAEPDPDMLIDWAAFWGQKRDEAEWLAEPILPAKRSVAMFAPGGTGKSLLALWLAAGLATGSRLLGPASAPLSVLYLDYEMTEDDLAERLENMGYGPHSDLSRLHYALLPSLPGLDEPEGGKAVVELARSVEAELVVIDTFGRAVHGDENDADTVRAWYRWTGINLKAEGRAFVRVDHAGKDLDKGQRGTSAKNDDVDVVWRLARQDGDTFRLTAKKRRMGWVPETVDLVMLEEPHLAYGLLGGPSYPAGTKEIADALDELGVPLEASRRVAAEALKNAGRGARALVIGAALKWRREALPVIETAESGSRNHLLAVPQNQTTEPREPIDETPGHGMGTTVGNQGEPTARTSGNHGSPPKGEPVPSAEPERPLF